jgi:hypothetical protein
VEPGKEGKWHEQDHRVGENVDTTSSIVELDHVNTTTATRPADKMPIFRHGVAVERRNEEEDETVAHNQRHHGIDKHTKFVMHTKNVSVERQNRELGKHDAPEVDHVTDEEPIFRAVTNIYELPRWDIPCVSSGHVSLDD